MIVVMTAVIVVVVLVVSLMAVRLVTVTVTVTVTRMVMPMMIMAGMVVMIVVVMIMVVSRRRIGAALGIERRLDRRDLDSERRQHRLDGGIGAEADPVRQHLRRKMPTADLQGGPNEIARRSTAKFDEMFRCGDDVHKASVIEHEGIAATQHDGLREVEFDREAAHAARLQSGSVPVGKIQHHRIGRHGGPKLMLRLHGYRTRHHCRSFSIAAHVKASRRDRAK